MDKKSSITREGKRSYKLKVNDSIKSKLNPYAQQFDFIGNKGDNFVDSKLIEVKLKNPSGESFYIIKFDFDWKRSVTEIFNTAGFSHSNVIAFDVPVPGFFSHTKSGILKKCIEVVDDVLKRGVKPENIVLEGYCYCGAVATLTAKHFFDKGIRLNLYSDRSFAKVNSFFGKQNLEKVTAGQYFKKVCAKGLISPLENFIYTIRGFRIKPGKAFMELYKDNPDRTNYTVFRGEKDEKTQKNENDAVVAYDLSIHSYLKELRQSAKKPLKDVILYIDNILNSGDEADFGKLKTFLEEKKTDFGKAKLEGFLKDLGEKAFDIGLLVENFDKTFLRNYRQVLYNVVKDITHYHKVEKLYDDNYYKEKTFEKVLKSNIERYSSKTTDENLQRFLSATLKPDAANKSNLLRAKISENQFFNELYDFKEASEDIKKLTRSEMIKALGEKWLKDFNQLKWYKDAIIRHYHGKLGHHTPQWELYSRALWCPVQINTQVKRTAIREKFNELDGRLDLRSGFFEEFVNGVRELNQRESAKGKINTLQYV